MAEKKTNHKTQSKPTAPSGPSFWKRCRDFVSEWNFKQFIHNDKGHFIVGLVLFFLSLYVCAILISFLFTGIADQSIVFNHSLRELSEVKRESIQNWGGIFGAWLSHVIMYRWFGVSSLLLAGYALLASMRLMRVKTTHLIRNLVYTLFLFIWISLFCGYAFSTNEHLVFLGGAHGYHISEWIRCQTGDVGLVMLLLVTMIIFLCFVCSHTIPLLRQLFRWPSQLTLHRKNADAPHESDHRDDKQLDNVDSHADNEKALVYVFDDDSQPSDARENEAQSTKDDSKDAANQPNGSDHLEMDIIVSQGEEEEAPIQTESEIESPSVATKEDELLNELGEYDPTADLSHFQNPTDSLLKNYEDNEQSIDHEEQNENKNKIIEVLGNFNIGISSISATIGPTVTLYEIVPEAGIRISRIKGLADDIALNLSALGIRIIAPIPGKGTVGIEVPRRHPKMVSMRSLIRSRKFQETKFDLPIVLGKTIMNELFMFDLCKMPHLLVAGATGQGKSVGLNALITSLLYKKHPGELKIVLVDPKMVEFSIYKGIEKHFLAKVPDENSESIITESDKVIQTLQSLTIEMDDRYRLLKTASCRNIKEYNEKFKKRRLNPEKGHKFMPYIVIIIDEYGDLIMTAGREIEIPIARIAQKARAVGMHMVIATQRPTTNIITGNIKANFPGRIAFKVSQSIDSRTILDTNGAEQLIGKGDALVLYNGELVRIQCAFIDTPEVENVVGFIAEQQGYPSIYELPEYVPESSGGSDMAEVSLANRDPLFEEVARMVVAQQQASTSYVQRKFSIGFNRAGRIMDQLERAGIVGEASGAKPRQVIVESEMQLDLILSSL